MFKLFAFCLLAVVASIAAKPHLVAPLSYATPGYAVAAPPIGYAAAGGIYAAPYYGAYAAAPYYTPYATYPYATAGTYLLRR